MYLIIREEKKMAKTTKIEYQELDGYLMPSKNHYFKIQGQVIKDIKVMNKKLVHPLISSKVFSKYQKLINYLMELLISDDESGASCRQALNEIERFRQEIKNKYRKYLTKKELETMGVQLEIFQKEAKRKFFEIQDSFSMSNHQGKGR